MHFCKKRACRPADKGKEKSDQRLHDLLRVQCYFRQDGMYIGHKYGSKYARARGAVDSASHSYKTAYMPKQG